MDAPHGTGADRAPARVRTLASPELTGGSFDLVELDLRADGTLPPHVHHREDQALVVVEGRLSISVGTELRSAAVGDLVFLPRGVVHQVRVDGDAARVLALHVPGGLASFTRARSDGDLDPELLLTLAAEHGVEVQTPPFPPIRTTHTQENRPCTAP